MQIYKILPQGFAANCYLLTADGKTALAIDPGQERVVEEAAEKGLNISAVLLTHGHFDHTGACNRLDRAGVPVFCAAAEQSLVTGEDSLYRQHGAPVPVFSPRATLRDGDLLRLCGMEILVIATPGHTAGGLTYRVGNALFTGDTLFRGSVGRTDLPTGDGDALTESVHRLYTLPGDFTVFAGHGEDSTLGFERKYNPFVRG